MMSKKYCIECKERPARYWSSNFCEECFRKLLREKLDEDNQKAKSKKCKNHA